VTVQKRFVKKASAKKPAAKKPVAKKPAVARTQPAETVISNLVKLGSAGAAVLKQQYFGAAPGKYGEGDRFLGISLPKLRSLARDMSDAGLDVALPLLRSSWHEARSLGLILLVRLYERGDVSTQKKIYELYMKHTKFINNWDLVDMSAERIVGAWLEDKDRSILARLAKSKSLWERRIAILATFHYIKKGEYTETLRIAQLLLKDEEDLIQKAVGWMLREVGKRVSSEAEESFLKRYYMLMPRTMLRYAIERFSEPKRKRYLSGLI
jgi:3-methyladenine DNA glycosylase AlkD